MFESILSSKTSTRLLFRISRKPYGGVYLNGLAREAKAGVGVTKAALERFYKQGILLRLTDGNRIVYRLDSESRLAPELVRLANLDALLGLPEKYQSTINEFLRRARKCLGDNLSALVVYGSVAKGTAKSGSDIDILLITREKLGREAEGKLREALSSASDAFSRLPEEKIMSEASFREGYELGDDFLANVLRDGIIVHDADGYYTRFLMRGVPRATRAMIEKKLETAERWIGSAAESYRKEPLITASLLGIASIHLSGAFLLLKGVQPGSKHEIPDQLKQAGEGKFATVYKKAREWEDRQPLDIDKERVWEYLSFLREKKNECIRMLQSWR